MQSDAPLDLTSVAQLQTILVAVQTTIQNAVNAGTFSATDIQQVGTNILAVRLGHFCAWFGRSQRCGGRGAERVLCAGTYAGCVLHVGLRGVLSAHMTRKTHWLAAPRAAPPEATACTSTTAQASTADLVGTWPNALVV